MLVLDISKGRWLVEDYSFNGYHRIAIRASNGDKKKVKLRLFINFLIITHF